MTLQEFFAETYRKIDAELNRLVPDTDGTPRVLYEAMRWSLFAGGKRIRPALLLAVGKTFDADEPDLLRVAAAVEMIHTYSLIHDDLPAMDNDDLRRGRETCHKRFGEATAILAGDALQALAFETIARDEGLDAGIRVRLLSELGAAAAKMVAGQQLDLEAEGRDIAPGELETIHRNKTGALLAMSARAGALVGGAGGAEYEAISGFADHLGLLFQITDDLLDITQSTETLGKTAGKDEASNKATYPSVYGIVNATQLANAAHAAAAKHLSQIERPTSLLAEINDFILERTS